MVDNQEFESGRRRLPTKLRRQKQLMAKSVEELVKIAKSKDIDTTNLSKKEIVNALSGDRGE